jgi:hypothetical protein
MRKHLYKPPAIKQEKVNRRLINDFMDPKPKPKPKEEKPLSPAIPDSGEPTGAPPKRPPATTEEKDS